MLFKLLTFLKVESYRFRDWACPLCYSFYSSSWSLKALNLGYAAGAKKTTAEVLVDLQAKVTAADSKITVSYDAAARTFKFVDTTTIPRTLAVSTPTAANTLFGLTTTAVTLASTGLLPNQVAPNSESFIRPVADQRFGIKVTYNTGDKTFSFASGTTGDASTISITPIDSTSGADALDAGINPLALSIFGLKTAAVAKSSSALRGIASTPAVAYGTSPSINMNNNFSVTAENNSFIVAVDDVRGTVTIPVGSDYSLAKFKKELETQINLLADSTGKTVNGVKVNFDTVNQRFNFTTATASSASFIKVSGKGPW